MRSAEGADFPTHVWSEHFHRMPVRNDRAGIHCSARRGIPALPQQPVRPSLSYPMKTSIPEYPAPRPSLTACFPARGILLAMFGGLLLGLPLLTAAPGFSSESTPSMRAPPAMREFATTAPPAMCSPMPSIGCCSNLAPSESASRQSFQVRRLFHPNAPWLSLGSGNPPMSSAAVFAD